MAQSNVSKIKDVPYGAQFALQDSLDVCIRLNYDKDDLCTYLNTASGDTISYSYPTTEVYL